FFMVADVVDDAQVGSFCDAAREDAGVPQLLLNNAALINRPAPLWEVSGEEFSRVVDVNIKGVANVLRHALPIMIENGRGIVVN
ncbi:MAG: SDR family oxidoreductase, partial [Akkermansiaceae bacterium]|nr:SDR family oxidoreductase [Akkermansiaceae bacterium]